MARRYDQCACGERKQSTSPECRKCHLNGRANELTALDVLRTQDEIVERINDAIKRGDEGDEFNEYTKQLRFESVERLPLRVQAVYEDVSEELWSQLEGNRTISRIAKTYLPFIERAVRRDNGPRFASIVAQFRAWKWLLGHPDADLFASTKRDENYLIWRHRVYCELVLQIASGAWDRMTKQAAKGRGNETGHQSTTTQASSREALFAHDEPLRSSDRRVP